MEWINKRDGVYSLTVEACDFDPQQKQWVEQHPESHLFAGQASPEGAGMNLDYSLENALPLAAWLTSAGENEVLEAIRQLVWLDRDVAGAQGKIFYRNIQTDRSMLCIDKRMGLRLMYVPLRPEAAGITDQQSVQILLETVRYMVSSCGRLQSEQGKKLLEVIDDPYLSMDMLGAALGQDSVRPRDDDPYRRDTPEISAAVNEREIRMQPVAAAQAVSNAIRNTLEQPLRPAPVENAGQQTSGALESNAALNSRVPQNFSAPASFQGSKVTLAYGSEEMTADSEPVISRPAAQAAPAAQQSGFSVGADMPTEDSPAPAPAGVPTTMYFATPEPPAKPPKMKAQKPPKKTAPKVRKPRAEKKPRAAKEPAPEKVPQELTFEEQKRRCWTARMILAVASLILLLFTIILFSFSNPLVVIAFLLVVIVAALYLFKQGYAHYLVMPKAEKKEPQQPELAEVLNVRMKLQSVNLASVVEITIREREQVLGSSASQAAKPTLSYTGISRRHCKISCVTSAGNDVYYVEDLNSKYGTELNGSRLIPGQRYPLHFGDSLTLAHKYKFVVHSDAY